MDNCEKDLRELKELIKYAEEFISPGIKNEIAELPEQEQKEILEKAKWKVIDQLIGES